LFNYTPMTVYKCLHGLAPTYLVDDCHAISAIAGKRHLRSADTGTLFVPRTTTTLGMRSFAGAGPRIWNSLLAALRTATLSPLTFARHLKSHLFEWQRLWGLFRTRFTNLRIIIIIIIINRCTVHCTSVWRLQSAHRQYSASTLPQPKSWSAISGARLEW